MRVLLDGSVFELPGTGVARATTGLYQACVAAQPGLTVSVAHSGRLSAPLPPGWTDVPEAVAPACARLRPDLVHFPWNGKIPRLPRSLPSVMTLHDVLPLEIPGYFKSWTARARYWLARRRDCRRAGLVITDSEYSRQRIRAGLRTSRDPLVVYPASLLPSVADDPSPAPEPYFLYVGGYDSRKGLEVMLELYLRLRRAGALTSRLVFTGTRQPLSPSFRQNMDEALRRGWAEEKGYLDDATLARCFKQARALIYPSRFEGFGLPPLEAMSLGCPVLTTPRTSLPEVCGDAVLYADPGDAEEFGRRWTALEHDAALRQDLKERGLRRAAQFSWDRSARLFLDAVNSLLRKP